ncbi:hypothetical protein JZ751_017611, partial [Albula glossodonta]
MQSAVSSHRTGPPPISPSKRKHSGDQPDDDLDSDNEHVAKMSRLFAAQLVRYAPQGRVKREGPAGFRTFQASDWTVPEHMLRAPCRAMPSPPLVGGPLGFRAFPGPCSESATPPSQAQVCEQLPVFVNCSLCGVGERGSRGTAAHVPVDTPTAKGPVLFLGIAGRPHCSSAVGAVENALAELPTDELTAVSTGSPELNVPDGKPANGDYRKDPRDRSRSPIERATAPAVSLHGNHLYAHMPSLAMDQPLALTKNSMDAARTVAMSPAMGPMERQQNRPSVITCASANNRNCNLSHCPVSHNGCTSSLPSNYRRPSNTNTACDPVIEEHFRRSLGKNYKEPEPVTNSVSITGSVDDHFAKALGETWLQIKAKGSGSTSPDSSPSSHMVNHNHSPS